MTEAELLASVRKACLWLALPCYHTHDSRRSESGFPDLVIAGPRGVLFRELKVASRVSRAQLTWLDALTAGGADVAIWRPYDWPATIMAELRELAGRS